MRRAILVTYDRQSSIDEALGLCDAAGYEPIYTTRQRFLKRPKYGIGTGTLERLKEETEKLSPDVIIYDEILNPSQNYNLASTLHREILDRETLILQIFESRASSTESKLQIRLAQLRYEMARARERVRLSSMGEQPGFMGIGKFGVDVYYNDIKHRMNVTRAKLEKAGRQRELHRNARRRAGFETISLAGYTSAGKTTLFNKMTGDEKGEKSDGLFTTLSTTVRRAKVGYSTVLMSDTVGFISKLPAYMIDAFRSTLEELKFADLVVLVVDLSDAISTIREKIASCLATLDSLGVCREKIVYALNKADLCRTQYITPEEKAESLKLKDNVWVVVSAETGDNIDELAGRIWSMMMSCREPYKQARQLYPTYAQATTGDPVG